MVIGRCYFENFECATKHPVDLCDVLIRKPIFFTSSSTSKDEEGGEETLEGPLNLQDLQKFKKAVQVYTTRAHIWKRLRSPGTDFMESIPPGWESFPGLFKRFTNSGSVPQM
jgi:hypothetical protein